jgi:hypothetical protein
VFVPPCCCAARTSRERCAFPIRAVRRWLKRMRAAGNRLSSARRPAIVSSRIRTVFKIELYQAQQAIERAFPQQSFTQIGKSCLGFFTGNFAQRTSPVKCPTVRRCVMFKKLGLSALVLGTALTVLGPGAAQAREPEREHHRHRFSVFLGFGSRHYTEGYYDRWGYWHPYGPGYYDSRGRWHSS